MKKNILGIICTVLVIAFSSFCINANAANNNVNAKNGWNYEFDYGRIWAYIDSSNAVDFDPPYDGGSELVIQISDSKNHGYWVIIGNYNGQFFSDELNRTKYVRVSFDNDAPIIFLTSNLSYDSSESDALFLKNPKKFVELAKKAKTIKVEAYFFDKSWRVFTFNTEKPLVW